MKKYALGIPLTQITSYYNVAADTLENSCENTWQPSANITMGSQALVISSEAPKTLRQMNFGFTPCGAAKPLNLLNARIEGTHNKNNDPGYTGAKGIIRQPLFRKAIRSQRCLVLANGLIVGVEPMRQAAHFIYKRNTKRPFAMAGIWDHWMDPISGEVSTGFAILTGPANRIFQNLDCFRAPIILSQENETRWLRNDLALSDITGMLQGFDSNDFNAYPIDPKIRTTEEQNLSLLKPIGPTIYDSSAYAMKQKLVLQGMGNTASRQRREKERKKEENGVLRRTFGNILKDKG